VPATLGYVEKALFLGQYDLETSLPGAKRRGNLVAVLRQTEHEITSLRLQ
jgi:hypothetical protein